MTDPEVEEAQERIAEIDLAIHQLLPLAKDEELTPLLRVRLWDLLRQLAAEQSAGRVKLGEIRAGR